jgi:hypothetical protein
VRYLVSLAAKELAREPLELLGVESAQIGCPVDEIALLSLAPQAAEVGDTGDEGKTENQ